MTQPQSSEAYFPARTDLINRKEEMRLIYEAIDSEGPSAIMFIGVGGIGKTRILEEILSKRDYQASRKVRSSDIIDLYHPVYHNPDNVQFHIAEQIDPQNRFFQDYRGMRAAFLSAEEQGVDRDKLAELADRRDAKFLADYQALVEVSKARVLLLFDTTEQIQHESDVIQALRDIQTETLAIHTWLTDRAPLLPNTAILLAGRPRPEIEGQIKNGFTKKGWEFKLQNLNTFAYPDALEYIDAILKDQPLLAPLSPAEKDWIFKITEGKPIRIALVLQYIHYLGMDDLRVKMERDGTLDKILIEHLIHLPGEYGDAMHYMLLARNGMDAALLAHLTGWPEDKITRYFQDMRKNILFKPREGSLFLHDENNPRERSLFLHDELYELHDSYFCNHPDTQRGYATLANYYQDLLKQKLPYRQQLELRNQALFYELQQHLELGYQQFSAWDEEIIYLHFRTDELRLRDEMLKFTNRYLRPGSKFYDGRMAEQVDAATVDSDNGIRCIEREVNGGKFAEAIALGEKILNSQEPVFANRLSKDVLYRARIHYGWAEASLFRGFSEITRKQLQAVIELLEGFQPKTPAEMFWKARTLGRAYNRFGYYFRVNGYYAKSIPYYRRARAEFDVYVSRANKEVNKARENLDYLLAQTLTNLSFVLAQTGDIRTAYEHVQEALSIWEGYGLGYRKALSLFALSRNLVEEHKALEALEEIKKAKEIVQQIKDNKASCKLLICEGCAHRDMGNKWKDGLSKYPKDDANKAFEKSENCFLEAERLLDVMGDKAEVLDHWEVINELGSLYCDWAWLHRSLGNPTLASTCYMRSIEYHIRALTYVRGKDMPFQVADNLDDLARVHGDQSFFLRSLDREDEAKEEMTRAENTMSEAEATVPSEYWRIDKPGYVGSSQPFEEGAPFWLLLGKSHLWRGVWKFRQLECDGHLSLATHAADIEKAVEYLLVSQVYLRHYTEESTEINRNLRYLSFYVSAVNADFAWMEKQIEKVENQYNFPLPLVRKRMQNKLPS